MFNNLGWGEMFVLGMLALLVFGPERLPSMAAKAGRALRDFRRTMSGVSGDLRRELGVDEIGLRDELRGLHPRRLLFDDGRVATPPLPTGEHPPVDPDAT